MITAFGTYLGVGLDNTSITGVGFQPDMVIIKGTAGTNSVWAVSSSAPDTTLWFEQALAPVADCIQAFESDGFQIGADAKVNTALAPYRYIAFKNDGKGDFVVGSYTGNAVDDREITGVGFQPEMVILKSGTTNTARWKPASMGNTSSKRFTPNADDANVIQALSSDGFQIGTDASSNGSGVPYYYAAFKAVSGFATSGVYTGNGTDNTDITTAGFQPDYVWVKAAINLRGVHKSASNTGEPTMRFNAAADDATNVVQAFGTGGFQVGTDAQVNTSGTVYHYMAWKAGTTPSLGGGGVASYRMMVGMGR